MEEPVHRIEELSRRARALETGVVLVAKHTQSGRAPLRRVVMKHMRKYTSKSCTRPICPAQVS
jgi:hypothetical protein